MSDSVAITVEFDRPFFEVLQREADQNDTSVEDVIKQWCWVHHDDLMRMRFRSEKPTVEVEVPSELYKRAEILAQQADRPGEQLDNWIFNQFGVNIDWVPSE